MAIQSERTGVEELVRDALYHYAAVSSDPNTQPLAAAIKASLDKLRKARSGLEQKSEAQLLAESVVDRAEYEVDLLVRQCELEALADVGKNRQDPRYRAAFPDGLTALISKWGGEQARAIRVFRKQLDEHFAQLAKKYGKDLEQKAQATEDAERKFIDAQTELGQATRQLAQAKLDLVQTLRRSEAALLGMFPGQKAKVRTYFRQKRRQPVTDAARPSPGPS